MVVVRDRETGIADVVLPASLHHRWPRDTVLTDGRPFYLTPDEVCLRRNGRNNRQGSSPTTCPDSQATDNGRIDEARSKLCAFLQQGRPAECRPDDSYFKDKEVFTAKLTGKELQVQATLDVAEAVDKATNVQFERIQMLRDDNNRWALYLKPVEGKPSASIPIRRT